MTDEEIKQEENEISEMVKDDEYPCAAYTAKIIDYDILYRIIKLAEDDSKYKKSKYIPNKY